MCAVAKMQNTTYTGVNNTDVRNLNLDYIICSPLYRTRQTCNLINVNDVEVIYDKRLVERDSKSMQYKSDSELDLDLWYDLLKMLFTVMLKDLKVFVHVSTNF